MRILVIGTGSSGLRRANLLKRMGHQLCSMDIDAARLPQDWTPGGNGRRGRAQFVAAPVECFDAAIVCTPVTTHIPVALRCLESGFRAVFVEQPLATDPRGIDELRASASGRVVMVGCALRFAFDLPRYSWSLLELFSCKPASHWLSRAAVRIRSKRVSLEVVYPEIDLAYGANGRIHRITCLRNDRVMRLSIEHQNMSHSEVQIDETGLHDDQRYLTVTAYDDGEGLRVLHQPLQQVAAAVDQMYAAEMKHFLDCIEQGVSPCNTIEDAAHVLFWALQTARAS